MEVYYKGHLVERMERVHGDGPSLGRWCASPAPLPAPFPGAAVSHHALQGYDALREWRGERADVEYVRILHLAATTMEATVDSALSLLLEAGQPFDYAEVRDLAEPKVPEAPLLTLSGKPDLKIYDRLLTVSLATAGVCA